MGEVYRARHLKLGRDVALKVLPTEIAIYPELRLRFERGPGRLRPQPSQHHHHPRHRRAGRGLYIAMELVAGRTLRALLADGALPVSGLLALARQMAEDWPGPTPRASSIGTSSPRTSW